MEIKIGHLVVKKEVSLANGRAAGWEQKARGSARALWQSTFQGGDKSLFVSRILVKLLRTRVTLVRCVAGASGGGAEEPSRFCLVLVF